MTRFPPPARSCRIALVGVPNCGKTALFNRLTGSHQKVANYPGVTVERKEGAFVGPAHTCLYQLVDLPGTYSLVPTTLDEAITRDFVAGRLQGEAAPQLIICVVDATNLRLSLRLVLELKALGLPLILALNMSDLARSRGYRLDRERLASELGVSVVETIAVRHGGEAGLVAAIETQASSLAAAAPVRLVAPSSADIERTQRESRRILDAAGYVVPLRTRALTRLDAVVMNPFFGPLLLAALLFLMFQAVFSWAAAPMDWISSGIDAIGGAVKALLPAGLLQSLLVEGVLAGAG